ncbi:MAG: hypothetical protein OXN84_20190 [Albidovulum sp.]|nr:hypothetical protein [Albidovulum sp.]
MLARVSLAFRQFPDVRARETDLFGEVGKRDFDNCPSPWKCTLSMTVITASPVRPDEPA